MALIFFVVQLLYLKIRNQLPLLIANIYRIGSVTLNRTSSKKTDQTIRSNIIED
jgi:hypothetical protein